MGPDESAPSAAANASDQAGQRTVVEIDGIAAGGAGVGRLPSGRVVFVHRTAPGDRAQIELTSVRKRWARGRLLRLVEPGPERRDAPCPHYERCGGCTLEHLAYDAQLQAKVRLLTDALRRIGGRDRLPSIESHPSPREFRYRNRVSFTLVRRRTAEPLAGFHELERPGRIVDVDARCRLFRERLARVWSALREAWGPDASRLPPGPELRLTLREVEETGALLFVEGGTAGGDPEALVSGVDGLLAVWHRPEGEERARHLAGNKELEIEWAGERYPARPGAFLQANPEAARRLHDMVLRELGPPRGRSVVDAYCGVGVYGRRMARHGARAVGIELDPEAVEMARSRPVEGFTVLEGAVEERLSGALPADLVVLNPPRSGVDEAVMETLARTQPHRIVYVSCDPATLARDLDRLGPGYRVARLQVFDLFPQTAHVEAVATLDHHS